MNTRLFFWLLRRKRFYFSLAFIGLLVFAYDFLGMRQNDFALRQHLQRNPFDYEVTIGVHKDSARKIRYAEIGDASKPLIVFIHGAPSSISFWETMLTDSVLLSNAKLMAVDRPGYGYSDYGKPETSIREQARLIAEVIRQKRAEHEEIIIHGSSYGGTVAARIAMDYPNLIDGLLLQSASLAPGEEETYSISYFTHHWLVRWLIPGALRVANYEKLSHQEQLEKMRPLWKNVVSPAIILQGNADKLIYPSNASYAFKRLVNAKSKEMLIADGSGHDLLWTRRNLLVASLMKLLGDTTHYADLHQFNK